MGGFDPSEPLGWDDLDLVHDSGPLPASPSNEFAVDLPDRSGRHILYQVWQRSDSPEAFYSCSDVVLGGVDPTPDPLPVPGPMPTLDPMPVPTGLGGYWMVEADGQLHGFGDAADHGGDRTAAVSMATTPLGTGVWVLRGDGSVRALDGAAHHGDVTSGTPATGESPSAMSVLADGSGYWVFTDRGRTSTSPIRRSSARSVRRHRTHRFSRWPRSRPDPNRSTRTG